LVLGVTTWGHAKATKWLVAKADLEPAIAKGAVIGTVLIVLAPLVYSGVKNTLAFARLLADVIFPSEGPDPLVVRVSRHTLKITVLLAATLGIVMPTVAVLGPVVGTLTGGLLLGIGVFGMGLHLYRSAHALRSEERR